MLKPDVVKSVDDIVAMQKNRTLQNKDPINRSRFIEQAITIYLESLK